VGRPAFIDSIDGVVSVKLISREQPHSFLFADDIPLNARCFGDFVIPSLLVSPMPCSGTEVKLVAIACQGYCGHVRSNPFAAFQACRATTFPIDMKANSVGDDAEGDE
jgi:hypothetical protein